MNIKDIIISTSFLVIVMAFFLGFIYFKQKQPTTADVLGTKEDTELILDDSSNTKELLTFPGNILEEGKDYQVKLTTSKGDILLDLFEKEAPLTVSNFVYLSEKGFYEGTIFHRVIQDFMVQGGDPAGTGTGGPGYTFQDEFNNVPLVKGSLAMANRGPATNGSQFFIVTAESTPWLDGKHTNFGKVLEGQEIIDAISSVAKDASDKPLEPITITKVEIIRK